MEDILLLHRKTHKRDSGPSEIKLISKGAVWKTCLRQISFFNEDSFEFQCEAEDQILKGAEALKFLLEVLTGLHSPVLGETEVLGQFKLFIEIRRKLGDPLFSENRRWLNFLMAEVKRLRCDHVAGLGSNSYGGIIRQQAKNFKSVTILGSGHLAKEILPWMIQKTQLQIVCRNLSSLELNEPKFEHVQKTTYSNLDNLGEVLVVAAPLSDSELLKLVEKHGSELRKIFDLRAEDNQLKLLMERLDPEVLSLEGMFAELAGYRKSNEAKVARIKNVIIQRVDQFMERSELRPMGWDDLCA